MEIVRSSSQNNIKTSATANSFSSSKENVQRKCSQCEEEEKLQRKENCHDPGITVPPIVSHALDTSAGKHLDENTHSFMGARFGYDFSNVKIHDDELAAKSAESINANAYTFGNDIVFNAGQYNSNSNSGKRLLAHELTHVVQQDSRQQEIPALQRDEKDQKPDDKPKPPVEQKDEAKDIAAPCKQTSKADSYVAGTKDSMGKDIVVSLGDKEFGNTSKLGAYFGFGACNDKTNWFFFLNSLIVPIDSKVQPIDFRKNINTAADAEVTKASYPDIVGDLLPNITGKFTVACGAHSYQDTVTSYSNRTKYWNQQFVIEHEAFHRKDWDDTYRAELGKAEKQIWSYKMPLANAPTAEQAVVKARPDLEKFMIDAYDQTCQAFAPKKESRAYDHGAAQYQKLVDEIKARAKKEKW